MKNHIILFLLILIAAWGCKKLETPVETTPEEDWSFPADSIKQGVTVYCNNTELKVGDNFDVKFVVYNMNDVIGIATEMTVPSSSMTTLNGLVPGKYFAAADSNDLISIKLMESKDSRVSYGITYKQDAANTKSASGSGVLYKLKMRANAAGEASFTINRAKLSIIKRDRSQVLVDTLRVENCNIVIQ